MGQESNLELNRKSSQAKLNMATRETCVRTVVTANMRKELTRMNQKVRDNKETVICSTVLMYLISGG
jgi:hypothetical protein